jgi:hypothetical protein
MTLDEVTRYDRQIRAWGFETQRRLHNTRFLFIGITFTSLECMKNLVLAGASSVSCVLDPVALQSPEIQRHFDFLHTLNPHCPVTDLPEKFDFFDEFEVIGIFNNSIPPDQLLKDDTKVFLLNSGISSSLIFSSPNHIFHPDTTEITPTEQTIIGALISQMIVDYLPPLSKPISLQLQFDSITWSSSVISD